MMKKIVVGIDGSESSEEALRWAVDEGRLHRARVVAAHAWELPAIPVDVTFGPPPDFVGELTEFQAASEELVSELVKKVVGSDSTVTVEPVAIEGPAATVLIEASSDADLLVVGSRGHGGFADLLLGSVSQQCVNHASCPVLVHRRLERKGSGT